MGRAHGALHPTAVEVDYEGSEHVRRKFSGYNFELKSEAREITKKKGDREIRGFPRPREIAGPSTRVLNGFCVQ